MPGTSPTARQRELGTRLRGLRTEHGMTVEEVADKLLCSATKISRLETGARRPSLRDVRDLCTLYELDKPTSDELMSLAREAREQGWWTQYDDLDLELLIGLEQEAEVITCYSMSYVPGLLQTEEYARGIIQTVAPKMDLQIVHQRTEARLRRQQLLAGNDPPRFHVLLDEAILHRGVGGPALMAAQLGAGQELPPFSYRKFTERAIRIVRITDQDSLALTRDLNACSGIAGTRDAPFEIAGVQRMFRHE